MSVGLKTTRLDTRRKPTQRVPVRPLGLKVRDVRERKWEGRVRSSTDPGPEGDPVTTEDTDGEVPERYLGPTGLRGKDSPRERFRSQWLETPVTVRDSSVVKS